VRVKLAMSLDGRTALANGASKWITGDAARADVQHWRARSSAILSGSGTVLADNPHLTVRLTASSLSGPAGGEGFRPLRVILDRHLRTPADSHVLDAAAPTLLLHAANATPAAMSAAHIEYASMAEQGDALDLHAVLALLAARDCNEVHVEAGPTLCGALFAAGLVDELLLYIAPVMLGSEAAPLMNLPGLTDMADRWSLRWLDRRMLGSDIRLRLRPA
jgi:diaminohydroxyphosphoribosylaminopyrimidine deaminase/5-amino-6-(5-phosphoribosylamino)uracil reductase